jgi:hypothetical protein
LCKSSLFVFQRKFDEKERKLKAVKDNISQSMAKAAPGKFPKHMFHSFLMFYQIFLKKVLSVPICVFFTQS